ncbi:MAG TPA: MATE family efflux transporter [Bauldia sp.]|nr:MATE family efflux transporter [Bauldia sp.]
MTVIDTIRPFEVTHRGVLAIAVPMTLAYLSTPIVGVVNLGVVGQIGDPALVGGVSIGALIFDFVFATFNFLRAGTTGLVAQAVGADDRREASAWLARALILALAIGLAVVLLRDVIAMVALDLIGGSDAVKAATREYWDIRVLATPFALANYVILGWLIGLGRAGSGLALQILLNGVNIALSVAFVHRLGLGVAGVGWASFAAETAAAAIGLVVVLRLTGGADWPRVAHIIERVAFLRMVAVNRDIMIRSFALLFGFGFFTAQSARSGDVVLAANEILLNLTMLAAFLLDGLAAAAEQFAGRAIGARYRPGFERSLRLIIGWGFAVAVVVSAVMLLAGQALIDLMSTSPEVRETARIYLPYAALVPLAGTLAYQMDGVFIGATWSVEMRNMMLLSLAVYLITWWLLATPLGITGLWIALLVFVAVRGATLLWRSFRLVDRVFPQPETPNL